MASGHEAAERRRRRGELVAFADAARLDLAFVEQLAAALPGYLEEARRGSDVAMLGTVKALENVYDALEDLAQRIETTFAALPTGPEWHKDLLHGLARPRQGLRPAVLSGDTVRAWDDYRAFRHFGRHRVYREGAASELVAQKVAGLAPAVEALRADMQVFLRGVLADIVSLGGSPV